MKSLNQRKIPKIDIFFLTHKETKILNGRWTLHSPMKWMRKSDGDAAGGKGKFLKKVKNSCIEDGS